MADLPGVTLEDALRLFEDGPDIVSIMERDPDGMIRVVEANPNVAPSAGWSPDDLRGRPIGELAAPDAIEVVEEHFAAAIDSGEPERYEIGLEVPSGRRYYDVTLIPISAHDGADRVISISRDRTIQHQTMAALREVEEVAHVGVWSWDMLEDVVIWSDELYRIYGTEPGDFPATYEAFLERVHPDDRDTIRGLVTAAVQEGKGYELEHRIVRDDGAVRLLSSRARVFTDATGRPVRLGGTAQDVTEQRAAEDAARRFEEAKAKRAQALELNDNLIQGLSVIRLALMQDQAELALATVDRTLEAARDLVSELLQDRAQDRPLVPGDLVRERHSHVAGQGERR